MAPVPNTPDPISAHYGVLAKALALIQAIGLPYDEAQTLFLSGLLHIQRGEAQQARERLETALTICKQLGEQLYARQIEQALATVERCESS